VHVDDDPALLILGERLRAAGGGEREVDAGFGHVGESMLVLVLWEGPVHSA
jgi:hypothetical protein